LWLKKRRSGFGIDAAPLGSYVSIEELHRFIDSRFYDPEEFRITEHARKYLKDIVTGTPPIGTYGLTA
jgi:6-phosphofructokinase 1